MTADITTANVGIGAVKSYRSAMGQMTFRSADQVVAILCLAAVLAGCAPTEEWVKPGVSDAQRDRDASECLFASAETVPTAQGPQRRLNRDRYRRCMNDRGYTVKKTGQ